MSKLTVNHITVRSPRIPHSLTMALCPDFHNGDVDLVLSACKGVEGILIAGDLVDRHARRCNGYDNAVRFLQEAPDVAPTFYAIGNHERLFPRLAEYWPHVEQSRVTLLDNRHVAFGGIVLGGLSSRRDAPDTSWLTGMAAQEGFKLLMCHHPEHFRHVMPYDIDLTLSGHAHGGQVRFFGQGLFAPGQGILPKMTSGFYFNDRLLVSRGVTNGAPVPRFNCSCELILLHLERHKLLI